MSYQSDHPGRADVFGALEAALAARPRRRVNGSSRGDVDAPAAPGGRTKPARGGRRVSVRVPSIKTTRAYLVRRGAPRATRARAVVACCELGQRERLRL